MRTQTESEPRHGKNTEANVIILLLWAFRAHLHENKLPVKFSRIII